MALKLKLAGALVAAIAIGAVLWHVRGLHAEIREAWLVVDSLEVDADTAREVAARELGDSLRAWTARVRQGDVERTALERRLGMETRARIAAQAQVTALTDSVTAAVRAVGEDRVARFGLRSEPYTIDASVVLPPPPRDGTLNVDVRLDAVPLTAALGCRGREAWVTVTGPTWATLALGDVRQDAGLCNPPVPVPQSRSARWYVPVVAGAAGGLVAGGGNLLDVLAGAALGLAVHSMAGRVPWP